MQPGNQQSDEHAFFDQLKRKTEIAYRQSDVFIRNPNWSYSICGTPMLKGVGLLVGLNWGGGGDGEIFSPQTYPDGTDVKTYAFIKRFFRYLNKYLKVDDPKNINYSNLSFFRSPKMNDLTDKDWNLSKEPFQEYLQYIDPPWIILASSGIERAKLSLSLSDVEPYTSGNKVIFNAYKAKCFIGERHIQLYSFPHPNAKVPGWIRDQLWDKTFSYKI